MFEYLITGECVNWIQLRSPVCRVYTCCKADDRTDDHAIDDGKERSNCQDVADILHDQVDKETTSKETHDPPTEGSDQTEDHRFVQKHLTDIRLLCTDTPQNPDLFDPLIHRDEHHI